MSEQFEVGDVVQLKSGSEKMTVEEIEDGEVSCVWFVENQLQRAAFPSITLKKVESSSGSRRIVRG